MSLISDEMETDAQIVIIEQKNDYSQMNIKKKSEFSARPEESECIIDKNAILS